MSKLSRLDQAISYLSPVAGAKRARARRLIDTFENIKKRKFEGADAGRRTKGWFSGNTSANAELAPALSRLRSRSRDLVRNNAYAKRAVEVITTNTVGHGIMMQVRPSRTLQRPPKSLQKRADLIQDYWRAWAESKDCDADGRFDLYGFQALVMHTIAESGECLIRRRRRRANSGLSVPLQLQVLEPDYIDEQREGKNATNGNIIIQGIEFNSQGKRVAYYLHTEHPGGTIERGMSQYRTIRVPANEILHVYKQSRPGAVRGVPFAHAVILRLRDFDEYEDAQLVRQKLAAAFVAFVRDIDVSDLDEDETELASKLEAGTIEMLPPGKSVEFAKPPEVQNYGEYSSAILHAVASGFGITYESLTGDFSQVNFSSARMGHIEFSRNIDAWRWQMIIPLFCEGVFDWFAEALEISQGLSMENLEDHWSPPARALIDPGKEIQASKDAIRSGLSSLSAELRQRGIDPEKHFEEIRKDNEKADELGLIFDTDPRKINGSGSFQTGSASEPDQDEPTDTEGDSE